MSSVTRLRLAALTTACWLYAPALHAEARAYPSFELSVGPELMYAASGSRCARTSSDVVSCTSLATWNVALAPRVRLHDRLALGGLARLGFGDDVTSLHLAVEGRFLPLGAATVAPFIGLDLGALLLFDRLPAGELGGAGSATQALPAASLSLGLDFAVASALSVGFTLRAGYAYARNDISYAREPDYDPQLLLSGGVQLSLLLWR